LFKNKIHNTTRDTSISTGAQLPLVPIIVLLWQNPPLLFVFFRPHGKDHLCRAFFIGPTAKKKTHGKILFLACVFSTAHDKIFFSLFPTLNKRSVIVFKKLCCALCTKRTKSLLLKNFVVRFVPNARQTHVFAFVPTFCALFLTHDKLMSLSCTFFYAHGKIFFLL
jgi:hypothetical protein